MEILKQKKSVIIAFIIGIILASSIAVYAATINASDIDYKQGKTVEYALNDLYNKSSQNKNIYYLGTGSSFDIKTILPSVDYTKLTANNFIIEPQSYDSDTVSGYTTGGSGDWINAKNTLTKTYDNTTGILNVKFNLYAVGHISSKNQYYTETINTDLTTKVYLVLGNIETIE